MKKLLLLLLFVFGTVNAQIINFPDANFKAMLVNASPDYPIASTQIPNSQGEVTDYTVIDTNGDGEIQVSEALAIKSLVIYTDPFSNTITDVTGIEFFQGLIGFKCRSTQINNLPISNLINLVYLDCSNNNLLTTLDLTHFVNLETLKCDGNSFTSLNFNFLPNLHVLDSSYNPLMLLDLSHLNNLVRLTCNYNQLTNLNLAGLSNIQYLDCSMNQISNLNLTDQVNLQVLNCSYNLLTNLSLNNQINLINLGCGYNLLTNLSLTNQVSLQNLYCPNNLLSTLDVSYLVSLNSLNCFENQLTSLNVNNLIQLTQLDCSHNLITNLSFNNVPLLQLLNCSNNHLTSIDVTNLMSLNNLNCGNNNLTTLNLNNNNSLDFVDFLVNPLETVFMKNGRPQYYPFVISLKTNVVLLDTSTTPVQFICVDDTNEANYWLNIFQNTIVCNDYCSFNPGGNHNSITGAILFDANNNGCDSSDLPQPNVRVNINDGTTQGSTFTSLTGNYTFYTPSGSFIITPDIENPTWFVFSPTTATIPFVDNNNNIATQNFCITANGVHNDIEIFLMPISSARPGFNATYKIVYKNKGNQILSGDLNFTYNDSVLDYVSSNVNPNIQSTGNLGWNYTNLLPFESRSFTITLHVNAPTVTPPVNIGDLLNFTATINPISGDETPLDNVFAYNQTVVGAFDPNNKICLEGEVVASAKIGDYLHYNINFENTGTAPAENIVVKDVIDTTKYDINSLQIMNSSHSVKTRITGNKVEFIFQNINLGASQYGNVVFKIKTLSNLTIGTTATNTANIYFDYNFPIQTNTASTTFQNLNNGQFVIDNSIVVSPNPTSSYININVDNNNTIKSVQVYDIQGRLLETKLVNEVKTSINLSEKTMGIYFLKITSDKGSKVEKIVKE